jgi:hypothetical protein
MFKVQVGVVIILYTCIQGVLVSNLSWDILLSWLKSFPGLFSCSTGIWQALVSNLGRGIFFILVKCFVVLNSCCGGICLDTRQTPQRLHYVSSHRHLNLKSMKITSAAERPSTFSSTGRSKFFFRSYNQCYTFVKFINHAEEHETTDSCFLKEECIRMLRVWCQKSRYGLVCSHCVIQPLQRGLIINMMSYEPSVGRRESDWFMRKLPTTALLNIVQSSVRLYCLINSELQQIRVKREGEGGGREMVCYKPVRKCWPLTPAEPFLRSCQLCTLVTDFVPFYRTRRCLQVSSTGPYPKPDQFIILKL